MKIEQRIKNFEQKAFGMFIHYGLYSSLSEGEWILFHGKRDKKKYFDLIKSFTAQDFDAVAIARLAKQSGMKYITLTARHHEGFSLYDTRGLSNFDITKSPGGRDLVSEFVHACRDEGILPMLYHTTLDWYQEDFEKDFSRYLEYLRKSIEILCTHYGEIGGFWFDGNWSRPDADWRLDDLYGTIRRLQANALIINNTGLEQRGVLSHDEIDSVTFEQALPKVFSSKGESKHVSGEMCLTLNDHWGATKNDFNYKSTKELIEDLCICRSKGANFLLNIGLESGGKVPKIQEATLEILGGWLTLFGDGIYNGRPSQIKSGGRDVVLKSIDGKFYAFIFDIELREGAHAGEQGGKHLRWFHGFETPVKSVVWLDNDQEIDFIYDSKENLLCFYDGGFDYGSNFVVRVAEISLG